MVTSAAACEACGFANPRAWRTCARCGRLLATAPRRTGLSTLAAGDKTVVDASPEVGDDIKKAAARAAELVPALTGASASSDLPTHPEAPEEVEPPLIGQTEAAEAIRVAIENAFTVGAPTLVALEGERGSGKTRLLTYASELAARMSPDVLVLYGNCREDGGDGTYAPFSRVVLDRFGVTPSSKPSAVRGQMATAVADALQSSDAIRVAETTHLLGHVAGIPFPDSPFLTPLAARPEELHKRAARAVRHLLEGDSQRRHVLVLLDNVHHATDDGWGVLEELAQAEGHMAIVLAGAPPIGERAGKLTPPGGVAVGPIEPLREDDVAAMLHVMMPRLKSAPEPLVAALTHRSRGNPSSLRELLFALLEGGLFRSSDDGLDVDLERLDTGELPLGIEDAIRARLARLDAIERATLDRAAIVGEVFWDGAILAQMRSEREPPGDIADPLTIWRDDEDQAALSAALVRLADKGFVEKTDDSELPAAREYRFVHSGTRTLLYDEVPEPLRVERHAAIARWLSIVGETRRESVAPMIAPHLERAGQSVRAGRAYLEAAAYERAKLRNTMALRYIEKALPLIATTDVARKIDALHEHGSLLTTLGRYDDAITALTEMLKHAWMIGARGKGGAALNRIARVHRQRGEDEKARALLTRALELFREAADLRGVASTLDDLAQVLRLRGDNDAAYEAAIEALEIRRAHDDRRGEALSLTTLGSIELARGELDASDALFNEALGIRRAIGDHEGMLQSYNALGIVAHERGDRDTAIASWRSALDQAREMADRRSECFLLNNIGEALLSLGRLEEAAQPLSDAKALAKSLGDRRAMAEIERNLGLLALRKGDDDAEQTLESARKLAEEYGSKEAIALSYRAIGQLRARTLFDADGAVDRRAEESFLSSIDLFREIGNEKEAARSLAELGYHLIERGDVESARDRLGEARSIMRRIGLAELEKVDRTLGELGQRTLLN